MGSEGARVGHAPDSGNAGDERPVQPAAPSGTSSVASSSRPRLLDLFCGAGGAAEGYYRAGFRVVGVDINNQPHYPFMFTWASALEFLAAPWVDLSGFDAIHASPPCQHYSDLAGRNGNAHEHPDLIAHTRELLEWTGLPYVIENVEGAPLREPVTICGTALGLGVDGYRLRRHRLFEANFPLVAPPCACANDARPIIDVSGGGPTHAPRLDGGGGRTYKGTVEQKRRAMGISWMTGGELVEAIPPAYTSLIAPQIPVMEASLAANCGGTTPVRGRPTMSV